MKRKYALIIVALVIVASCIFILWRGLTSPTPAPLPTATPTPRQLLHERAIPLLNPSTIVPGEYVAWGVPAVAIPPTREPSDPLAPGNEILGVDCLTYLGSGGDVGLANPVWDTAGVANINWSPINDCISGAAAHTVTLTSGVVISQPVTLNLPPSFMDSGARYYDNYAAHDTPGTGDNPFVRLHLPPWMQNSSYRFNFTVPVSGQVYESVTYDGAFKTAMIDFIDAAGAEYDSNDAVSGVRLYVGYQGESQPSRGCTSYWDVIPPSGADGTGCNTQDSYYNTISAEEATVTCSEYFAFIKDLSEAAYVAFPSKPVVVMASVSPCSSMSAKSLRRSLYTDWEAAGKYIGVSINSIVPDIADADQIAGNVYQPWSKITSFTTLDDWGMPAAAEYGANPQASQGDWWQYYYWTTAVSAFSGADFTLHHSTWNDYYSKYAWEVTDWAQNNDTQRAWLIFRDIEWSSYNWSAGYGTSGLRDDLTQHLTVLNDERVDFPQACSPFVKATADAYNSSVAAYYPTPACPNTLPTPASTAVMMDRVFDRQARILAAGDTLAIAANSSWWPYGLTSRTLTTTVSYLDNGISTFRILLPNTGWHTITRTNTHNWKRETWATSGTYVYNSLSTGWGNAMFSIENNGSDSLYLHELYVDTAISGGPTPTPVTPTPTSTPSPTSTPWPDDYLLAGYMGTPPTLDGDLSEWLVSDLHLKTLRISNADYHVGVDDDEDASSTIWAAYDSTYLYLAIKAVDDHLWSDTVDPVWDDDTNRIGLTSAITGTVYDLSLTASDTITSFVPPASMVYSATHGSTWYQAEIKIPLVSLGAGLGGGSTLYIGWAMLDDDNGDSWDGRMVRWTDEGLSFAVRTYDTGWGLLYLDPEPYQWNSSWTPTPAPTATQTPTPTGTWATPTNTPTAYFGGPTWTPTNTPTITPTPTGTWQVTPVAGACWETDLESDPSACTGGSACGEWDSYITYPAEPTGGPYTLERVTGQDGYAWQLTTGSDNVNPHHDMVHDRGSSSYGGKVAFSVKLGAMPAAAYPTLASIGTYLWDWPGGGIWMLFYNPVDDNFYFLPETAYTDGFYFGSAVAGSWHTIQIEWFIKDYEASYTKVWLDGSLVVNHSFTPDTSTTESRYFTLGYEDNNQVTTTVVSYDLISDCPLGDTSDCTRFATSNETAPAGDYDTWYNWTNQCTVGTNSDRTAGNYSWDWLIPGLSICKAGWDIPLAYQLSNSGSIHLSADIKLIATSTVSGSSAALSYFDTEAGWIGPSISYKTGGGSVGNYEYTATDGSWYGLDYYCDLGGGTPAPGEVAGIIKINNTPMPTPTGAPDRCGAVAGTYYKHFMQGSYLYNNGVSEYRIDNVAVDICTGSAYATPTPGVTPTWTPGPTYTPGPTVTPAPIARAYITEIFPRQGVTCVDWNHRADCGTNDEFIEVYSTNMLVMSGWKITISGLSCKYDFPYDSIALGFKLAWQDDFIQTVDSPGDPCQSQFPTSGTVSLYDATGELVDTRWYPEINPGLSYQPYVHSYPAGSWGPNQASPGW